MTAAPEGAVQLEPRCRTCGGLSVRWPFDGSDDEVCRCDPPFDVDYDPPYLEDDAMSTCRTCSAEIWWARTGKGKNIALDMDPVPHGTASAFYVTGQIEGDRGPVTTVTLNPNHESVEPTDPGYITHFSTCPDADEHRQPRSSSPAAPAFDHDKAHGQLKAALTTALRTKKVEDALQELVRHGWKPPA